MRFGHRKLRAVEAVAQNDDVLLHGVVLPVANLLRGQHQLQRRRAVTLGSVKLKLRLSAAIAALPLAKLSASRNNTRTRFAA